MDFRILGALEVEADGVDVTPARPQRRALLALLLLRAGEVVSTDELIEALWGGRPPATAPIALQGHISELRKAVGRGRIATRRSGYMLTIDDGELDAHRFERAVAAARGLPPHARSEALAEALALFRGEPLADFRYEAWAASEAARLDELRLVALEERIEADVAVGRHADVLPELDRLVEAYPLRERLQGLRALALYRGGRQADALASLRAARAALVDQLGVEPGPALRTLERQILNQDAALAAPELATPRPVRQREPGIVSYLSIRAEDDEVARALAVQGGGLELEAPGRSAVFAFARTRDAALAALAVHRGTPGGARAGLHAGDARGGQATADVLRAAALSLAASHGQVLASRPARDLLAEAASELDLRDAGRHGLSDLAPPGPIFELVAPELEGTSRPPHGLDARATNLPVQSTALVGRGRELVDLWNLLVQPEGRVVTLTGPGGTGKTRLALHAAAEALEDFPDGVYFIDLAPVSDPALVLPLVARTVGVGETTRGELPDVLRRHLRGRDVLLVVDNLEHLLEAAGTVADLAPAARVLATSRVPLRVGGERRYAVSPLDAPPPDADPDVVARADSVALFADRARRARADFTVDADNAAVVANICATLDGLPLALELAAARIAVLEPAELLDRLAERLKILSRAPAGAPERHRTLRGAVGWSHDLLEAPEQGVFARLSVFAGGWTLAAAEAVCGDGVDVLDALSALTDASLVRVEETELAPRFGMLETIRQFAAERLDAAGDRDETEGRHADYFLALAEAAEPHLREQPGEWLATLEAEHDNLRAALEHLQGEDHARLAGALWRFWYLNGHIGEGGRRLNDALAAADQASAARGKALIGAAVMAVNGGDTDAARRYAEEGIALHHELGDRWSETYARFMLAAAAGNSGDQRRACELLEESIPAFRELGDEHSALLAARLLAAFYAEVGDDARSRALYEDNLRRARSSRNPRLEASTLGSLAMLAFEDGDLERASQLLVDSLRIHRRLGDVLDTGVDLCRFAAVCAALGRPRTAVRLLASFDAMGERVSRERGDVGSLNEQTLDAVRREVGEPAFSTLWAEGRELDLFSAVDLALEAVH